MSLKQSIHASRDSANALGDSSRVEIDSVLVLAVELRFMMSLGDLVGFWVGGTEYVPDWRVGEE